MKATRTVLFVVGFTLFLMSAATQLCGVLLSGSEAYDGGVGRGAEVIAPYHGGLGARVIVSIFLYWTTAAVLTVVGIWFFNRLERWTGLAFVVAGFALMLGIGNLGSLWSGLIVPVDAYRPFPLWMNLVGLALTGAAALYLAILWLASRPRVESPTGEA